MQVSSSDLRAVFELFYLFIVININTNSSTYLILAYGTLFVAVHV